MIFFILGTHPDISTAEIKAVLGSEYAPIFQSSTVLLNKDVAQSLSDLQERLGGVIKVGRIAEEFKEWDDEKASQTIADIAVQAQGKNKICFGLSVYDLDDAKTTRQFERNLDGFGLNVKKLLKTGERPVRYVKGKEKQLSSAIVETNGLLTSGGEFCLFVGSRGIFLGQTIAIQNFKSWSDRDYGRPARDAKSGMLPPKLARMMINLSGVNPKGTTILDPFCGSGTVLMEATLMGSEKLIGSDISERAVADTTTNMDWLVEHFRLQPLNLSLFTIPAEELPSVFSEQVDLLVTEVFLGDPRTRTVSPREEQFLAQDLMPIFEESFKALKPLFHKTTKAVVAFPAFKRHDGSYYRLDTTSLLKKMGYTIENHFLYYRDNQFVARDITIFSL